MAPDRRLKQAIGDVGALAAPLTGKGLAVPRRSPPCTRTFLRCLRVPATC
jgi:hypothetical protein